jgi:hypothetical protein
MARRLVGTRADQTARRRRRPSRPHWVGVGPVRTARRAVGDHAIAETARGQPPPLRADRLGRHPRDRGHGIDDPALSARDDAARGRGRHLAAAPHEPPPDRRRLSRFESRTARRRLRATVHRPHGAHLHQLGLQPLRNRRWRTPAFHARRHGEVGGRQRRRRLAPLRTRRRSARRFHRRQQYGQQPDVQPLPARRRDATRHQRRDGRRTAGRRCRGRQHDRHSQCRRRIRHRRTPGPGREHAAQDYFAYALLFVGRRYARTGFHLRAQSAGPAEWGARDCCMGILESRARDLWNRGAALGIRGIRGIRGTREVGNARPFSRPARDNSQLSPIPRIPRMPRILIPPPHLPHSNAPRIVIREFPTHFRIASSAALEVRTRAPSHSDLTLFT